MFVTHTHTYIIYNIYIYIYIYIFIYRYVCCEMNGFFLSFHKSENRESIEEFKNLLKCSP